MCSSHLILPSNVVFEKSRLLRSAHNKLHLVLTTRAQGVTQDLMKRGPLSPIPSRAGFFYPNHPLPLASRVFSHTLRFIHRPAISILCARNNTRQGGAPFCICSISLVVLPPRFCLLTAPNLLSAAVPALPCVPVGVLFVSSLGHTPTR